MTSDLKGLDSMDTGAKRELLGRLLRERATGSGEEFDLSPGQQALWFLHELAPDSAAYNVAFCARVRSEIDRQRLERALLKLMERHAMLRCTIARSGQGPRQRIGPVPEHCLEIVDASGLEEEVLRALVEETYARPFDLDSGPVFRCTLFSRCSTEHVLLISVHHVFSDAWSFGILVNDLMALYNDPTALAPLPPTLYAHYVKWQRAAMDSEEGRLAWEYWQARLKDLPSTRLPADYPRPKVQSFRGASHHFELPAELCKAIRTLARAHDATPFMVVAAALHALLVRYCGSPLVPIGTPLFGRSRREDEGTVGYFINPVVLCAPVQAETTFRQHIADMRATAIGAQRFGEFPFPELVKRLQVVRDTGEMPIFQVMLNFIKASQIAAYKDLADANAQIRVGSLVLQDFPLNQQQGQFDLDLELFDTGGAIPATFKYRTDLFEQTTIERLAAHFLTLLSAAIADPDIRISDLPLLTDAERHRIIFEWNATAKPYPATTVHRLVEEQVRRTPKATALLFERRRMSYSELNRRANQLARRLRQLGVGPDTLVAVCLERSFEMVVALLGILKAGGAYVPIDPHYPPERQAYMIADCTAPVILSQAKLAPEMSEFSARILMLDSGWEDISRESEDDLDGGAESHHLAYVIYTSGSTGKPKGVEISHAALVNFLLSMQNQPGFLATDTLVAITTFCFDIAGLEIYLPLITGGRIALASSEDARDPVLLMNLVHRSGCTVLQATPVTWRSLIQAGWTGSPMLKALCGGEALSRDLAEALLPRCAELWNMYGPTETTVWSTIHRVSSATESLPIGKPIANTQIYILDAQRKLVPCGITGELYIGGDGLARGYLRRDELTRERFVANPFVPGGRIYRTGDLARWRPDGTVECLGRIDHQVKIRGFRIELGEIEAQLAKHPAVREVVVMAREDTPGDKRIVAYLTTTFRAGSPEAIDTNQLRTYLASSLPEYMLPATCMRLDALPLTPNGKVDRKALPSPDSTGSLSPRYEAPHGEMESKVAEIWEDLLNVHPIGRHDNFFELGGHSLTAVQFISRLRKIVPGEDLPLRAVLEAPTIERFATRLQKSSENGSDILVKIRKGNPDTPPLFCVAAAAGNALGMRPLAMALDPDVPFYCIQNKGLDGSTPFDSIEEASRCYLDELRNVQPHGPYRLAGYCFGAVVAFEMACLLERAGERVEALFIVDGFNPAFLKLQPTRRLASQVGRYYFRRVAVHVHNILSMHPREWLHYTSERLNAIWIHILRVMILRAGVKPPQFMMPRERRTSVPGDANLERIVQRMEHAARIAGTRYAPQSYGGDAIVFRATSRVPDPFEDDQSGWGPLVRGPIEVVEIEATHDNITGNPAIRFIAEKINKTLRTIPSRESTAASPVVVQC